MMKNLLHSRPLHSDHPPLQSAETPPSNAGRSGVVVSLLLAGASAGAALMYVLDPVHGRRRRAIGRDKLAHGSHVVGERAQAALKDVRQRGYGLYAEGRRKLRRDPLSDETLHARVRSKLGRYTLYSHAIQVSVNEGVVTLSGPALKADAERLLAQIGRLHGVNAIDNKLELHDDAANVPALQGSYDAPADTRQWTRAQRLAAGTAGASLLASGVLRRGAVGVALGALGAGLFAAGALTGTRRGMRGKRGVPA